MNEELLLEAINELSSLEITKTRRSASDDLKKIKERVCDKEFRIAVVGEFSSGKSTFINALLGKDLLSHATDETTAAITYIHNVPQGDERIGKCVIEYYDGNRRTVSTSELMNYTTAQSGNNVADTIRSVSVFEAFLEVKHPVVVVDTPGLNGIADKHRDITIEEIKHSHACIYLLQKKGISNSDTDFVSVLRCYQSRFIFVQNFIDDIHISEGETVEDKLADDLSIIENKLGKPDPMFAYDLCGISALKALASRDKNIKRLYDTSITDITSEERASLWEESRFDGFLSIITDMMNNGKYRDAVLSSAAQSVFSLINSILPGMLAKQEMNEGLQKTDKRSVIIERAKREIERIEQNRESQRTKLGNFVLKLNKENCLGLKEYAESELHAIYEQVCADIESRIPAYNELESFEFVHGKQITVFYSDMLSNLLNTQLIPEINSRMSLELSHLYDEAVQRVMEYTANVKTVNKGISVKVEGSGTEKFSMDDQSWRSRIISYEKDIELLRKKQNQRAVEIREDRQSLSESGKLLSQAQEDKKNAEHEGQRRISALGRMPDVKVTKQERTRYVDREGVWGRIVQFFAGQKKETYYVDVHDDSDRRRWQSEYDKYQRQQQAAVSSCNKTINRLQDEIAAINARLQTAELRSSHDADEIRNKERQIKLVRENYEQALKLNKQEFCTAQKKKLKNSIETKLFDKSADDCIIAGIEEYIDSTAQSYLGEITDKVLDFHSDSVEAQIAMFREMISTESEQLSEIYKTDEAAINTMISIQNMLTGGIENE